MDRLLQQYLQLANGLVAGVTTSERVREFELGCVDDLDLRLGTMRALLRLEMGDRFNEFFALMSLALQAAA